MRAVTTFSLRAKHWQIFLLLFGVGSVRHKHLFDPYFDHADERLIPLTYVPVPAISASESAMKELVGF